MNTNDQTFTAELLASLSADELAAAYRRAKASDSDAAVRAASAIRREITRRLPKA